MKRETYPIVEYSVVPATFVDDLSAMTTVGAVTHLIFSAHQSSVGDVRLERHVQARLIVPSDCLLAIGRAILAGRVLEERPLEALGREVSTH
jgi:hypothetical protein